MLLPLRQLFFMKTIIIGAGIGGLTAAIALQQKGIPYEIFDAAPGNRPVGAGLLLGSNAMNVYEKLHLLSVLRERSCMAHELLLIDQKGHILQRQSNVLFRKRFGNGAHFIHRAALQQTLLEAVEQPVQWGKRCREVVQTASKVTAYFEDGTAATGDLLIGADGIRSVVREQYVEKAVYRYSGQTSWRATVPIDLPETEQLSPAVIWGSNGFRTSFAQVGPQQVYCWFTKKNPAGQLLPPEAALDYLHQELRDYTGYMHTVLQHVTPDMLLQTDLSDIAPLRGWHHHRIVLIGDAAHATMPHLAQGASLAIEDAYVLAGCLQQCPEIAAALHLFEQRRMPRVKKIVRTSRQMARMANMKNRLVVWCRNFMVKNMPRRMADMQLQFLYGFDPDR